MKVISRQLKLGSLFDGSGTCPLAAILCGIEPVWASEIEKFPIQVTTKRFPNMKHLGDITKINGAEIVPVDIITFGSPCTNLSVAGKQNGFNITFECFGEDDNSKEAHFTETTRATDKTKYLYEMDCPVCGKHLTQTNESALFFNAIRIIQEMREATNNEYPRYIMWENVPGAFSSNKGSDFKQVLEEISETEVPMPEGGKWATSGMVELSDRQLAWRVLDAQYWGVPQRRKRIFLVTDFRGQCAGEILFKPESLLRNFEKSREEREGASTDFEGCIGKASGIKCLNPWDAQSARIYSEEGIWHSLNANESGGQSRDSVLCLYHKVTGTICASGAGTNRPAGQGNESDLCIVQEKNRAYSFDSLSSNSMKSKNPNSGCREVEIAKTIDTTNPDPSKNQGGIAIVQTKTAGFMAGQGAKAGGIGYKEELSPTLKSVLSGGNTIPSIVTYDARGNGDTGYANYQEGIGTLKSSGGDCGGGSESLITFSIQRSDEYKQSNKSHTLSARDYKDATDLIAGLDCRNGKENGDLCGTLQAKENGGFSYNCTHPVRIGNTVRRLTPTECARLQGFPDWWCVDVPHSDTAAYKMWGNGMALPCVFYIMQNIVDIYKESNTTYSVSEQK